MDQLWIDTFNRVFHRYSKETWSACIGVPIETAEWVWKEANGNITHEDLLLAFNFLTEYRVELAAACTFNMSLSTYRSKVWSTLKQLDSILPVTCYRVRISRESDSSQEGAVGLLPQ